MNNRTINIYLVRKVNKY